MTRSCMTLLVGLLLVGLLLGSCATPMPPAGGPVDNTPPTIVESVPSPGAVNVSRSSIRITFSEYVDQTSFSRALSITPSPTAPPEIDWSRRSVEVRFAEALRANTTYVVSLDNSLSDVRGVSLSSPLTLAFSTGPVINAGTLEGRVVHPRTGMPAADVNVFAYALGDSASIDDAFLNGDPGAAAPRTAAGPPAYRTQTDRSGSFRFEYLTEEFYFVTAVRDQNRNLAPDPTEEFAAPPVRALYADSASTVLDRPWVLTRLDTTPPLPLRVQSLSTTRHTLYFSEPVRFLDRDPSNWELRDSTTDARIDLRELYIFPDAPRQVFFTSPPLDETSHRVSPSALADTSANPVVDDVVTFTASIAPDTLQPRFLGFLPMDGQATDYVLPHGVEPGARFNVPLDASMLEAAIQLIDSTGRPLAYSALTDDGTTYRFISDPPLSPTYPIELRVDGSALAGIDSLFSTAFRRIPPAEMGEIRGIVESDVHPVIVEIHPVAVEVDVPDFVLTPDSTGSFVSDGLPAGTYRLRAYGDRNASGSWDGGSLRPYVPPEPVVWQADSVRVRARWETSLADTLRIRESQVISNP